MASPNMVGRIIKPAGVGPDTHYYGDGSSQMVSFPRVITSCQRKLSLNVHFSVETIRGSALSSDEVCRAGGTQQAGGRCWDCSPADIVELCCYKIDLPFQWVGNQRNIHACGLDWAVGVSRGWGKKDRIISRSD